jgi:hypothetical protein
MARQGVAEFCRQIRIKNLRLRLWAGVAGRKDPTPPWGLLQDHEQIIGVDLNAFFDDDFLHDSVNGGGDGGEHFHGFDDDELVAGLDLGAGGDGDFRDHAGEGADG